METIKKNKVAVIVVIALVIIPIIIIIFVLCVLFLLSALGINTAQNAAMDTQRRADLSDIQLALISFANIAGNEEILADIPECSDRKAVIGSSDFDLARIIDLTSETPKDPEVGTESNTGYTICSEGSTITLESPHANKQPLMMNFKLLY